MPTNKNRDTSRLTTQNHRIAISDLTLLRQEFSDVMLIQMQMCEFLSRYRFLTAGVYGLSRREMLYQDFWFEHIEPLKTYFARNYYDKNYVNQLFGLIQDILKDLISSEEKNETWSAIWLASVLQMPSSFRYRCPIHEVSVHDYKCKRKAVVKLDIEYIQSTPTNLITRHEFLSACLPDGVSYQYVLAKQIEWVVSIALTLIIIAYHPYKAENKPVDWGLNIVIFLTFPVLFQLLYVSYSSKLASYLDYRHLPKGFRSGLLTEVLACIDERIANHKEKLPFKPIKPTIKNQEEEPMQSVGVSQPENIVPTQDNVEYTHSQRFNFNPKQPKQPKRESKQVEVPIPRTLEDPTILYTWKTRAHGELSFQPGCVTDTLFLLWSLKNTQLNDKYVVLFPKEKLSSKYDQEMIRAFWKVARQGHIVNAENRPGFVPQYEKNKLASNYPHALGAALFKLKLMGEYGNMRAPVTRCALADEKTAHKLILLEVGAPINAHT